MLLGKAAFAARRSATLSRSMVSAGASRSGGGVIESEWSTLSVFPSKRYPSVLNVVLNRPDKANAMNKAFWREMAHLFSEINAEPWRCVILSANGKHFSAGLDLGEFAGTLGGGGDEEEEERDVARKGSL